jgi:hypothetical protein
MPPRPSAAARVKHNLLSTAFMLAGIGAGGAAGFLANRAMIDALVRAHPNDPSVGAGACVFLVVIPLGAVLGGIAGSIAAKTFLKEPPPRDPPRGFEVKPKDAGPRS